MKYFFLSFVAVVALVIGVFGLRGQKFGKPPIEVFPDMDRQDFVQAQTRSSFFHDGMGARLPVTGTVPHAGEEGSFPIEFGEGRTGHYYTGAIDDYFASGLPRNELELEGEEAAANMQALLRRGQERYGIYCAICHGESGDGLGIVSRYMTGAIANLHDPRFASEQYPNGQIYHVITHGNGGLMSSYGASIAVRDRWAIVAYVRALQESKLAVAAAEPAPEAADGEAAPTDGEAAPADGEAAPADGEAAPADGEAAPADGEAAPADGEAAPADGEAAPADGEAAPADGEAAPADEGTETDNGATN